jgi:MFS superfamily sulfate permease-like transporter
MVTKTKSHPFIKIVGLERSVGFASVFSLSKTEATSGIRTPLAEFAIKAVVLLILAFF